MRGCLVVLLALATPARADDDALTQLLAKTDDVAKQVARVRGLKLKKKIPNEVLDRAQLRDRLVKELAEDKTAASTAAEGLALQRWGMVPLDYDYAARMLDLLSDQIAGFYDPKTKKLTVLDSAASDPDWAQMVLTHELDHGLQDQAFDLEKFEKLPDDESDASLARSALVEGDGVTLMLEMSLAAGGVTTPWADPAVAESVIAMMNAPTADKDSLAEAPLAIREAMLFPYREGFNFVATLRRTRPWSAIDAAFKRPPKSTEQILHVDRYLADDKPVPVTQGAIEGFTVVDASVWGELGIRSFLRTHGVDDYVSGRAAAGWGGDRVVTLAREAGEKNPRKLIGVARFEWDTENDAREAQAALEHALDDLGVGATMSQTMERTEWLGLDGTRTWIERRGKGLVVVVGAPLSVALDPWAVLLRK